MSNSYFCEFWDDPPNEQLPNGYTRKDYYDFGLSDFDIEYWGMDQPGAPGPSMASLVIWDLLDSEFSGEFDF